MLRAWTEAAISSCGWISDMLSLARVFLAVHLFLCLISGISRAHASDGDLPQVQVAYFFNFKIGRAHV